MTKRNITPKKNHFLFKNQKTKKTQKGSNLNTNNEDGPLIISFENESHHDVAHLFFAADSCHDSKK